MKKILFLGIAFFFIHITSGQEVKNVSNESSIGSQIYDKKPEFPGGLNKFYMSIVRYLPVPKMSGINNKLYISFIVDTDGSMSEIKVLGNYKEGSEKHLLKAMAKSAKWIPAEKNGVKIECAIQFPITAN